MVLKRRYVCILKLFNKALLDLFTHFCLFEEYGNLEVLANMQKTDAGNWTCLACSYSTSHRTNMYQHVEAKHVQTEGYSCPYCTKFCPNFKSLKNHKNRCSKNVKNVTEMPFGF